MRKLPFILALAALGTAAPTAGAGTYEHHTLTGASPGSDGWSPRVVHRGGFVATAAGSEGLVAQFWARDHFWPGELAEWYYDAPAGTSIAAWTFERAVSGVGAGDWNTLFSATVGGRRLNLATDVPSRNRAWGGVAAAGLNATALNALLQCGGPRSCPLGGGPTMRVRGSRVTLHDDSAPQVTAVRGDLTGREPLSGVAALSLAASDRGGGVFRVLLEVDGREVAAVPVGDERCRDLLPGTRREFTHRTPCPSSAGATVRLDTRRLADGRHVVAVDVEDAAGNRTTAHGPSAVTIANGRPATPPSPAPKAPRPTPTRPTITAWFERGKRRTRATTVRHGIRVRVRGRITPRAATPITVEERPLHPPTARLTTAEPNSPSAGSRPRTAAESASLAAPRRGWRPITGVRSRTDGRFTFFTKVGPSRRLRIGGPGGPVLTLHVRAPVSVRVRDGRVTGRAPRGRFLVELQTRTRGRWVTRGVVRTWRSGRFSGRLPGNPPVRAFVPRQPGLPYAAGWAVSPGRRASRTSPRTSR